eukprot:864400-Rhodomonas_salina.1
MLDDEEEEETREEAAAGLDVGKQELAGVTAREEEEGAGAQRWSSGMSLRRRGSGSRKMRLTAATRAIDGWMGVEGGKEKEQESDGEGREEEREAFELPLGKETESV